MYKNKKILAIIPARGGSKRLPMKNIKMLAGKPLIAYSIDISKKSKYIDRIIVSTDDKEIADISKAYGSDILMRPIDLSKDSTPTVPVLQHVIKYLNKQEIFFPDIIVLLQPTSPLRIVLDVDETIRLMVDSKSDSAETFCEVLEHPAYFFKVDMYGNAKPIDKNNFTKRYQDLPKLYKENGAVFAVKTDVLMKFETLYGNIHKAFLMPKERSIDIDELIDFKMAEVMINDDKIKG